MYNEKHTIIIAGKETDYPEQIANLFPELHKEKYISAYTGEKESPLSRTVTFQVTDKCNLACTYCYQINKGERKMSFETAKKVIDKLLAGDEGFKDYISIENSPAIVLDFIGGEPFLQVDLIDKVIDYFREQALKLRHPWADKFRVSICSNGTLVNTPEVQAFLNKHRNHLSFSVTIDGNKELHDSCRIFPDGKGSYDLAVKAAKDWMDNGGEMGSKITIAPANVVYLNKALRHMIDLGYDCIHANCVYEEGWTTEHATELYKQMKEYSNYILENDLTTKIYCSLFEEDNFHPLSERDVQNWCGGTGDMLAIDPDGYLYPCLRYMESSVGTQVKPMRIGHVDTGIARTQEHKDCIHCLKCIDRKTQSTQECFDCPIAQGCSWCSAFNYQTFGTANKRATYICVMHKARALANAYYWNSYYIKNNLPYRFRVYVPREWAEPIIGREEYEMLVKMSGEKPLSYDEAFALSREEAKIRENPHEKNDSDEDDSEE